MDNAPARSAQLLAEDRVAAALVPVIEYQRIADVLLVPNVCVGAREKVRSVCLVTKGEDLRAVKTVALDASSKTSAALAQIIFREFLNIEPVYQTLKPNVEAMLAESDCALLIGDPALTIADCGLQNANLEKPETKNRQAAESRLRKFDLVELWRSFTGFGFVFAMWMTRAENCEIDFAAARDEGLAHLDEIISNYQSEVKLSREDFKKYLAENISYSVDENMRKGLELYFKLAHQNKLIDKNKPLKFV